MPAVTIELLYGVTNGVNLIFKTSMDYAPGSVKVFRNGMLMEAALDDGFVELGSKKIQMKIAPDSGEVLQAYYLPV
jgi:hypothetical protein